MEFRGDIHIMNPFDSDYDAMVLECFFQPKFSFDIDEDFYLYVQVDDVQIEFEAIHAYFKTIVNKEELNRKVDLIKNLAISFINSKLDEGVPLPLIPSYIKESILNPRIRTYDHFILIDAEPDLNKLSDE